MKTSSLAKWILIAGVIYTFAIFAYADQIGVYSKTAHPLVALMLYFFTQPGMILTIAVSVLYTQEVHKKALPGLFGGLALSLWADAISLPHCVSASGLPTDPILYACSDTILIKTYTELGLPFGVAYFMYYIVIALLLLFAGFLLLGNIGFTEFFGGFKRRK